MNDFLFLKLLSKTKVITLTVKMIVEVIVMNDREQIIALYRQENKAMVDKDVLTLNKILANDIILTHMTGLVQPKMKWIDQIQNGDLKYYSSQEDKISQIKIQENKASLVGQNRVKASVWGSSISTWRLQMKMYFKKKNGSWIIDHQVASTY